MKLQYNSTYQFSSADIFDNTEPEILFEVVSRPSSEWASLTRDWLEAGAEDVEQALYIVGMIIVSVSQNGKRYELNGREGAQALRQAIEDSSPNQGDSFIIHFVLGHYNYHFRQLSKKLGNSKTPSLPLNDGV